MCYRLWASPDLSYYVGNECTGGLFHATGKIAFFNSAGLKFKAINLFEFGGTPHIAFTEDSSKILISISGDNLGGTKGPSGMALMNKTGSVQWKLQRDD